MRFQATGGSAKKAIEVLIDNGVKEDRILFLNLLASPEGIKFVAEAFPKLTIISGWVDEGLDEKKYIVGPLIG
jgi:uracil phosphoribosyltransferase